MAIATLDQLIEALGANQQRASFYKVASPGAIGGIVSLWTVAGTPGAAANPSSGVAGDIPTDATAGAFIFTNPTAPDLTYLSRLALAAANSPYVLHIYDRLWQNSGLSTTSTSAQTVNSVALTRPDANGDDVEAWWQCYANMGSGAPTSVTISYTNQGGTSGRTGTLSNFVASQPIHRTLPFTLQAGDTGVRSIQSYTQNASLVSGTFGLVLRRKIVSFIAPVGNAGAQTDAFALGLPPVPDDACIELLLHGALNTNIGAVGNFTLIQG